ncbi:YciI family protein [Kribbella solani]|uniref:YciI family protein n=1 Tax=Kribbella solani TaxID=236067 RepID=UPI0029AE588F|nr:YciI family protein [Kribbella solani]MDX2973746.1 YciI family protein [Kribbella solani]
MTQYFVYGRDRDGAGELKGRLTEEHWAFMDRYDARLIARGPTLTADREASTGSLHIIDLPDAGALNMFVYDEPYYLGGAFATVEVYRFVNHTGRTMWEFEHAVEAYNRYLVLTKDAARPLSSEHLIVYGDLFGDDGQVGRAALVEAPDRAAAAALVEAADAEVHPWEFGGRR